MNRDLRPDVRVTRTRAGGRFGAQMTFLAAVGSGIAIYLLGSRILGQPPACGPVAGCERVAASEFSTVFGVPVALIGVGFSAALTIACIGWWRTADMRALYAAYGLGLAGIFAVACLTYLEIFVIEAICIWCVAYAVSIVVGWAVAALAAFGGSE
jgi:uncharacterized membrane protein